MLEVLSDCDAGEMWVTVAKAVSADAVVHLCHPFGTVTGAGGFAEAALGPLWAAMPDVERGAGNVSRTKHLLSLTEG